MIYPVKLVLDDQAMIPSMAPDRGKFIVFEGLDGAGKSSLIRALEVELKDRAIAYIVTREPGGTELGEEIRELLLRPRQPPPTARAELLLYEASRAQHVEQLIQPSLQRGLWVLCDRFRASSVAFQAGGRSIATPWVETLNDFATDHLQPDLTILLDLDLTEAKRRRSLRSKDMTESPDRMESESDAFHQRVRESFLAQAREHGNSWLVLDANQATPDLLQKTLEHLRSKQWLV
jgi:dTMP kinase